MTELYNRLVIVMFFATLLALTACGPEDERFSVDVLPGEAPAEQQSISETDSLEDETEEAPSVLTIQDLKKLAHEAKKAAQKAENVLKAAQRKHERCKKNPKRKECTV